MARGHVTDEQLMLARTLFRTDKWDPARDQAEEFAWEDRREDYIEMAKRFLRILDKDGFTLVRERELA